MKIAEHKGKGQASYTTITCCRVCGGSIQPILSLGTPYISDFLLPGDTGSKAPLELVLCTSCNLVQLHHTVDRDWLYKDYYYMSGTNESMVAALKDVVETAQRYVKLEPDDVVIDIGSNDSTLLRQYDTHNLHRLGFEPAVNLWEKALQDNIIIHPGFFPPTCPWYEMIPDKAKIITSIAMFYDLDDPNSFVSAIKKWLHPDGIWVVQFQGLEDMLSQNAFDNICHEHLLYLSRSVFANLLGKNGLKVVDIGYNKVNGGSIRYIIKHGTDGQYVHRPWVMDRLAMLTVTIQFLREKTLEMLGGKNIFGYGASTKGNTLLQYYGIDTTLIPYIADRNPEKWGRVCAGSNIPITSERHMHEAHPDYLFVLPWHFIDSFKQREPEYIGKFIVPLPTIHIT